MATLVKMKEREGESTKVKVILYDVVSVYILNECNQMIVLFVCLFDICTHLCTNNTYLGKKTIDNGETEFDDEVAVSSNGSEWWSDMKDIGTNEPEESGLSDPEPLAIILLLLLDGCIAMERLLRR